MTLFIYTACLYPGTVLVPGYQVPVYPGTQVPRYLISYKGFYTINGGTSESATEIQGAPGITRDVGFTAYSYKVQILILY